MSVRPGARFWLAFAACAALSLLLRAPLADLPLERDEGGYAYVASRWLEGEVPYLHSFEQKPPGIDAVYALILRCVGRAPAAIHWSAGVYGLGTLALLILIGEKLWSLEAGFGAGLLAAFLMIDRCVIGSSANTEIFMSLPLAAAFLAALASAESGSPGLAAAAGALSGLACLFKPSALADAAFYLALAAWPAPGRWKRTSAMLAGLAAPAVLTLFYFYRAGAARALYDCLIAYNFSYGAKVALAQYPLRFALSFIQTVPFFGPIYLLAAYGAAKTSGFPRRAALGWLAASALGIAAGGYFRDHYFIQALPAVALLAGVGASALTAKAKAPPAWALALAAVFFCAARSAWYYLPGSAEQKCQRLYGANPFAESVALARYIESESRPDDQIFIFGSEPEILFYARRRSASRYIYSYPLLAPFPETLARQREALSDIARERPRFIVTCFVPYSLLASPRSPREIFDALRGILHDSYRLAALTPLSRGGVPPLVSGAEAERLWKENPMWYGERAWASFAVWVRTSS